MHVFRIKHQPANQLFPQHPNYELFETHRFETKGHLTWLLNHMWKTVGVVRNPNESVTEDIDKVFSFWSQQYFGNVHVFCPELE